MKASELIKQLQEKIDKHGDLTVHYEDHCASDAPEDEEIEIENVEYSVEYTDDKYPIRFILTW
ncbi:MAG: hypothetical protein ACWGNI_00255 [Desulfobacterales bacterium]